MLYHKNLYLVEILKFYLTIMVLMKVLLRMLSVKIVILVLHLLLYSFMKTMFLIRILEDLVIQKQNLVNCRTVEPALVDNAEQGYIKSLFNQLEIGDNYVD